MLNINRKFRTLIILSPLIIVAIIILIVLLINKIQPADKQIDKQKIEKKIGVFERVKERKKLIALTDYQSTNYMIYRGVPMGFQYDLLKCFAEYLDVDLEIRIENNLEKSVTLLNQDSVDIIAIELTVNNFRKNLVQFCEPYGKTKQVLVQRLPEGYRKMGVDTRNKYLIKNVLSLKNKTIVVQKNTVYKERLENLEKEIGGSINIVELDMSIDEIIELLVNGKYDYTICDQIVAMSNKTYYKNIDIETEISFSQNIAWAVKLGADSMKQKVDYWFDSVKQGRRFKAIFKRYYLSNKSNFLHDVQYNSLKGGKISPYDDLLKKYSEQIGWDWRLLASTIFQESKFNEDAVSWAGARGLMQLMPVTAARFGCDVNSPAEDQIRAGVEFISYLQRQLHCDTMTNKTECVKLVLASYNIGFGHVHDAMKLAEKYGSNPYVWTNSVDSFLLKKALPKYYNDPVVRNGYCKGKETYAFVTEIFNRYMHYQNLIKK